jgi:hypothetical protein
MKQQINKLLDVNNCSAAEIQSDVKLNYTNHYFF